MVRIFVNLLYIEDIIDDYMIQFVIIIFFFNKELQHAPLLQFHFRNNQKEKVFTRFSQSCHIIASAMLDILWTHQLYRCM